MDASKLVYCIDDYRELASAITADLGCEAGVVERKLFADNERYLRLKSPVLGRDVILVGGTISDSATLDLFDMACGIVTAGAQSLTMIVPFFGYSTMERAVKPGEVVTAKTRARLLSAVPSTPFGNQVVLLDLHSEGIPFYFEGTVRTHHLYAKRLITSAAQKLAGSSFVFGCVDAGRAKWVESLANDMGVSAGFAYKRRDEQTGKTTVSGINVDVANKHVIIYDDMIRSGSSVLGAVHAYKDAGAKRVSVIATHGLFTTGGLKKLEDSKIIDTVVVTDSHPESLKYKNNPFLTVVSTASLFSDFIRELGR